MGIIQPVPLKAQLMAGLRPPEFVAVSMGDSGGASSTTLTITKPTGVVEGDLMVVSVAARVAGSWTGDTGWTEVADDGSGVNLRVAFKIAGPSEASSYTFTFSSSTNLAGSIIAYRDASYDAVGAFAPDAIPIVAPAVTVASNNSVLLAAFTVNKTATFSTPSGFTSRGYATSGNCSYQLFSKEEVSSGSSGAVESTNSNGGQETGILVSIGP